MLPFFMKIKLINAVRGKSGEYPADTWLPAKVIEGIVFISYPEKQMYMKSIERSNIKEYKNE
jgi:hypothetical protein